MVVYWASMSYCIDCLSHIYLRSLTRRLSISMLLWDCSIPARLRRNGTSCRYLSTSDSFRAWNSVWVKGNKLKAWDLKKNEGEAEQSIATSQLKIKKNKRMFCYMQPHLYIIITIVHVSQWHLQTHMISPSQVSSPAEQLFLFSSGRLKHGDTSFGSLWVLACAFMCRNMCVLGGVCVCVHLSTSVLLLHLPNAWWSL